MQTEQSIYEPLNENSIRLLLIKPGLADEDIECSLVQGVNLQHVPDFEALSYVWGNESSRVITCNGVRKVITHNLEVALRHLRPLVDWDSVSIWPEDHPLHSSHNVWRNFARNRNETKMNTQSQWKPVWIDSICINQDDPEERASQVKLMHEIYRKASTVKVFLGEDTLSPGVPSITDHGDVPLVLVLLEQAFRNIEAQETNLASLRPAHDYEHRNRLHGLPKPLAREWDVFRRFLANAWFQRTWVVQEIVLARKAVVIQGDWHIDWEAIGKATAWYAKAGYGMPQGIREPPTDAPHLQPLVDAANMWEMHQQPTKRLPLLDILKDFRCRAATQAVDKLYATFGLAEETAFMEERGIHTLLEPDYTKTITTVYRDLAKFLIIEYGSLIVLSHANGYSVDRPNWPSWVPDWSLIKPSTEIWRSQRQKLFKAGGDEALTIDLSGDDDLLVLEGRRVDTVRIYGDKLKSQGFGFVPDRQERDFVSTAWRIMKTRDSDSSQPSRNSKPRDILCSFIYTITTGLQGVNAWGEDANGALADAAKWFSQYVSKSMPPLVTPTGNWSSSKRPDAGRFHEAFVHACKGRRFFTTEAGRIGVGPEFMKEGDLIVVLFGGQVPYILREVEGKHRLIGECYIDGIMQGEAVTGAVVNAASRLPTSQVAARKSDHDSGSFQDPGPRVRPKFRYWIPDASVEADVVSQDVKRAKDAGMGGLELLGYYLYGGPPSNGAGRGNFAPVDWAEYGFGGEKWYEMFRSFAEAIRANDMVMDFAIGPNQGTGVPAPEDDEGLMWDISIHNQSVPIGGSFNGTLPGWGNGTLLAAVTGLEINTTTITSGNKLQSDPEDLPGDYFLNRTQITLSNSSLIDVTDKVDSHGQISLQFPLTETTGSGHNIFAIYIALSGYRAQQGPEGLGGPQTTPESWLQNGSWAVDHFSARGAKLTTDFWEHYILPNGTRKLLEDIGSYAWEDSIEIVSNVYWTRNLSTSFFVDHGYDISKWLPILFHRNGKSSNNPAVWWVTDEPDEGNSHIADYRSTLAGLYREYLTALNDWAHDYLGLGFSAQISYNLPMDMLANIPSVSVPETESLDFSDLIDGYRQYSGPAYLAGRNIVSSECGAVRGEGFSQTLPELLWHVKRSYAGGVNQFVFHGMPYSGHYGNTTWPGFTTFNYQYSDMHGPYQPGWQFYKEYMDFVGRNNFVLQSGRPKIDIAFWQKRTTYPGHVELRTYPATDLESAGYTYQYLSPDDLSLATAEDSVLAPDAQGFKALVLQTNDSLTVDGVNKLLEIGRAGLPIIFAGGVPSSYVGTFGPEEIQQANEDLKELTGFSNVHITSSLEVASALGDIGIAPHTRISSNGSWFTQWHRDSDNEVDYVFVYSDAMNVPQGQGESMGTIDFESTGIPYEYDAWTGDQRPIMKYKQSANTTLIPFQLAGNQSKIIAFHPEVTRDSSRSQASWESADLEYPYMKSSTFPELGRYPVTANATLSASSCGSFEIQNWTLVVEHWEAPTDLYNYTGGAYRYNTTHELESLQSWQDVPGLQNVSGIGYYSASFDWPPSQCVNNSDISGAMIDFGYVHHTLRASVNGQRLPAMDVTAPTADLKLSLKNGRNVVEAVVSTPLGNTLRTIWNELQTSGEGPASPDAGTVNKPPVGQYGLKQQVKIIPYQSNAL